MIQNLSPELTTFLSAMIPLLDIKIAIPLGKEMGLTSISAFMFAISGAIIPAAIFLAIFDPIAKFLERKSKKAHTILNVIFDKTRKNHSKNFDRYGAIFLIILVAVPIPGSGAGTGALVAYLFGVDYWKALNLISIGTFIAGILILTGYNSITGMVNIMN